MFSINILGSLPILLPISQPGNVFICPKWERGAIAIYQNVVNTGENLVRRELKGKEGERNKKERKGSNWKPNIFLRGYYSFARKIVL